MLPPPLFLLLLFLLPDVASIDFRVTNANLREKEEDVACLLFDTSKKVSGRRRSPRDRVCTGLSVIFYASMATHLIRVFIVSANEFNRLFGGSEV